MGLLVCMCVCAGFEPCEATVVALRCNNQFVSEVSSGEQVCLLLDQTCFYAESGGQIYDVGLVTKNDDEVRAH